MIYTGQISLLSTEDSKNICHLRGGWLCIDPYRTNKNAIYWRYQEYMSPPRKVTMYWSIEVKLVFYLLKIARIYVTSMEGDYVLIHTGQIRMLSTEDSKNICHHQGRWLCIDPYRTNKYAIYWRYQEYMSPPRKVIMYWSIEVKLVFYLLKIARIYVISKEGDYVLIHAGQIRMLSTEDSKSICYLQGRWQCIDPQRTSKYAIYWT